MGFFKTNKNVISYEEKSFVPFASIVEAWVKQNDQFPFKGIASKDSVIMIPIVDGKICMITEERPLFCEGKLAAFPAGKIEDGQSPSTAAIAELEQEAGLICKDLKFLGKQMPFLHICDEEVYFFVAICERGAKQQLEAGEFIDSKLQFMEKEEFKKRLLLQQQTEEPILPDAPMDGVSLIAANRAVVMGML